MPVPPFLLRPLVENAARPGLEPQVAGRRIEVSAAREARLLVLRVREPSSRSSVGRLSISIMELLH